MIIGETDLYVLSALYIFCVFRCKFWNCFDIPNNEENICCKPQSIPASLSIRVSREIVLIYLCLRPHFMTCYRLIDGPIGDEK